MGIEKAQRLIHEASARQWKEPNAANALLNDAREELRKVKDELDDCHKDLEQAREWARVWKAKAKEQHEWANGLLDILEWAGGHHLRMMYKNSKKHQAELEKVRQEGADEAMNDWYKQEHLDKEYWEVGWHYGMDAAYCMAKGQVINQAGLPTDTEGNVTELVRMALDKAKAEDREQSIEIVRKKCWWKYPTPHAAQYAIVKALQELWEDDS